MKSTIRHKGNIFNELSYHNSEKVFLLGGKKSQRFFAMKYEYRNIDSDINLFRVSKEYWDNRLTKQEVYDILNQECYTKWEADRAINDYYYVYILSRAMLDKLLTVTSVIGIILLVIYIYSYVR